MPSNISDPLTKKSDSPIEKVREISRDLDNTKKALVATNYTVVKEGNTDMVTKDNVVK